MEKLIVAILIFAGTASMVFATNQRPDRIIYEGKEYRLEETPMWPYFDKHPGKKPRSRVGSTGLKRGYLATFEFKANDLILKDIEIYKWSKTPDERRRASLKSVKHDLVPKGEDIIVDWFTGILVLPHGEFVDHPSIGYRPAYSNYILLEIKSGKLTDQRTYSYKEYEQFREKQFRAFKKTIEYKRAVEIIENEELTREDPDSYIRDYIVYYTLEILDTKIEEESSYSSIPGIALHFGLAVLASCLFVRLSGARFPSILVALCAVFVAFGLGLAWHRLSWGMWTTWDDLIIDPYKNWQILNPRSENIACFVSFSIGPLLAAFGAAVVTTKLMTQDSQQMHAEVTPNSEASDVEL